MHRLRVSYALYTFWWRHNPLCDIYGKQAHIKKIFNSLDMILFTSILFLTERKTMYRYTVSILFCGGQYMCLMLTIWIIHKFENTENKQLDWRIRHSHLVSTLFHSLVRWWRPRRIRPQITRLSQLENSAKGTWPIYKNSIIPDWFETWRDIKFWYRC